MPSAPIPSPRAAIVSINIGRAGLVALVLVLLLPWAFVAVLERRDSSGSQPTSPPSGASAKQTSPASADLSPENIREGEWGRLETNRLVIEPPADLVSARPKSIAKVFWYFPGFTPEAVDEVFRRASVPSDIMLSLSNRANWSRQGDQLIVAVPRDVVLRLSPVSREVIYATLAGFEDNVTQWAPASFRCKTADEWLGGHGLSEKTISLVRPLLYRRGDYFLLSDYELILADVESDAQRVLLTQVLLRSTVQLVKIRITPGTDLDAVIDYWSVGQKRRDIDALIHSLPLQPGGFTLDLIHLLPPAARRLLYTYPDPPKPGQEQFRDCHWTSLNFFRTEFDDRYTDLNEVMRAFRNDYEQVSDPPRLGDIYVISNQRGVLLHSCVYVAGDIVFTKNGAEVMSPWTLMMLPDVVALYQSTDPVIIRRLRARNRA